MYAVFNTVETQNKHLPSAHSHPETMKLTLSFLFFVFTNIFINIVDVVQSATVTVKPGESIQDALDNEIQPGDTLLILPGTYQEYNPDFALCGLRVSTDHITIRAAGKVTLLAQEVPELGLQHVGIYVAPKSTDTDNCEVGQPKESCNIELLDVTIEGITVEGFKKHGIHTRWVNGFDVSRCESINNDEGNGLYFTISRNGYVKNCFSTGSRDSALWVSHGEDVVRFNTYILLHFLVHNFPSLLFALLYLTPTSSDCTKLIICRWSRIVN